MARTEAVWNLDRHSLASAEADGRAAHKHDDAVDEGPVVLHGQIACSESPERRQCARAGIEPRALAEESSAMRWVLHLIREETQ